ncbi:MAG: DUF1963 domain-containing protein [Clostridiales bacterium]|nr:DUF1963 domain-containing protein [Clostridiales bacterium]
MTTSVLFSAGADDSREIDQSFIMKAAARISKTIDFRGSFIALPDRRRNSVAFIVDPDPDMSDTDTTRLLRAIAYESLLDITDIDYTPMFLSAPDTDSSFIDRIPAPEDEIGTFLIHFSISNIRVNDLDELLDKELTSRNYDIRMENDGMLTAYLTRNAPLDFYIDEVTNALNGEIDVSWAGAGVYAEVCELAEALAAKLGGDLEYDESDITYQYDYDMDALRQHYYDALRQDLAFAYAEARAGGQAFIGWQVCNFEPEWIQNTVITQLGRYDLDWLIDEIEKYGLETVADHCFYTRNYKPRGTADEEVKNAIIVINSLVHFSLDERSPANDIFIRLALTHLNNALRIDPSVPLPINEYNDICSILNIQPTPPIQSANRYIAHYPFGYLRGSVYVGFGSYIRHFRIDGQFLWTQIEPGRFIVFDRLLERPMHMTCRVEYLDTDAELDDKYFENFPAPEYIDIGGSAVCRFSTSGDSTKAEIIVQSERYMLIFTSSDKNLTLDFIDSLRGCRCIEELEEPEDKLFCSRPSAPGAFFPRGMIDDMIENDSDNNESELGIGELLQNSLYSLIETLIMPSVHIKLEEKYQLPITASKLLGSPYCPEGFEIPTVPETEETLANGNVGRPMTLIAQIDLNSFDAQQVGLPPSGILQFYAYDSGSIPASYFSCEQTYFRVVYFPAPPSVDAINPEYEYGLKFEPALMINNNATITNFSQIGGSPRFEAVDKKILIEHSEYTHLLLQIEAQDLRKAGANIGSCDGILNFFMKPESLKNMDFSDVLIVWTCQK